jgi:NAD-dependent SIR2 family protein deacetylase
MDWAAWYRARFGKEPNYSELLDVLTHSQNERRSVLHSFIEATAEDLEKGRKVPTRAHCAIAKLVRDSYFRVIITTNFDRLLENALRDESVEPTVIKSDDDLRGAMPLIHSRCYVLKIHGDYLDTRIRNTDDELKSYSKAMNTALDRILDERGAIVCGWSADWDYALRSAITRAPNRRYPFFWAARGTPK